jgi:dolichol-phosphate mannosyltransferase
VQLSIVIPTYNEAENLPTLISALFALPLEGTRLLVVDDNSPDGTGELVEELAPIYQGRLQVRHRAGKLGLGSAYLEGFKQVIGEGAEAIAQMDADFSHQPEKLVELVEALRNCDVALGSRYVPGGSLDERWPAWRKGLSAFGNFYARAILSIPVRDVTGGFRVWRRHTCSACHWSWCAQMAILFRSRWPTWHTVWALPSRRCRSILQTGVGGNRKCRCAFRQRQLSGSGNSGATTVS